MNDLEEWVVELLNYLYFWKRMDNLWISRNSLLPMADGMDAHWTVPCLKRRLHQRQDIVRFFQEWTRTRSIVCYMSYVLGKNFWLTARTPILGLARAGSIPKYWNLQYISYPASSQYPVGNREVRWGDLINKNISVLTLCRARRPNASLSDIVSLNIQQS